MEHPTARYLARCKAAISNHKRELKVAQGDRLSSPEDRDRNIAFHTNAIAELNSIIRNLAEGNQ